jgi:hypothetical protein
MSWLWSDRDGTSACSACRSLQWNTDTQQPYSYRERVPNTKKHDVISQKFASQHLISSVWILLGHKLVSHLCGFPLFLGQTAHQLSVLDRRQFAVTVGRHANLPASKRILLCQTSRCLCFVLFEGAGRAMDQAVSLRPLPAKVRV